MFYNLRRLSHGVIPLAQDFYTVTEEFIEVFKFRRSTDEAVEEWAEALDAYISDTPKKENFYILLDVSGDEVTFSAAAREHSKRLFTKHKQRQGYIAMLFEWRTSPYFARIFFATIGKFGFKLNYFHNETAAYDWLQEMHKENE